MCCNTKAGETRVTFLNEQGDLMRVDMGYPEFVAKGKLRSGLRGDCQRGDLLCDNFYNATCVSPGKSKLCADARGVSQKKRCSLARMWKIPDIFRTVSTCSSVRCSTGKNIQIEIYERGAGYTYASGTGACAAGCRIAQDGICRRPCDGAYARRGASAESARDGRIDMTGPVVYIGSITLAEQFFA